MFTTNNANKAEPCCLCTILHAKPSQRRGTSAYRLVDALEEGSLWQRELEVTFTVVNLIDNMS